MEGVTLEVPIDGPIVDELTPVFDRLSGLFWNVIGRDNKISEFEIQFTCFRLGRSVLVMSDLARVARRVGGYLAAIAGVAGCIYAVRWIVLSLDY